MQSRRVRSGVVIIITLVVIFLIFSLIGAFMLYYAPINSREFFKDLAEVRGYWGVYGAKERNQSITYRYSPLSNENDLLYKIEVTKNSDIYSWEIKESNSTKNEDIYRRELKVDANKKILSYTLP